jgi:hypothetical protein
MTTYPESTTVRTVMGQIEMSLESAMRAGLLVEEEARKRGWTPTVLPPPSRHERLRSWVYNRRIRLGCWLGNRVAGVALCDREDWL